MNLVDKIIRRFFFNSAWRVALKSSPKVYCSFCEGSFTTFLIGGVLEKRANATCPNCRSLERHRLMWSVLKEENMLESNMKMLHVAPEKLFYDYFSYQSNVEYVPCAKFGEDYPDEYPQGTLDRDLTKMPEPDNTYDAIICSHVLEHIPDDHLAMKELCRILKPGGWALLQVPLDKKRERTFEDWSITDPKDREMSFGQWDHVRVYGRDYKDRLEKGGFLVEIHSPTNNLSHNDMIKLGFLNEDIYIGRKA